MGVKSLNYELQTPVKASESLEKAATHQERALLGPINFYMGYTRGMNARARSAHLFIM